MMRGRLDLSREIRAFASQLSEWRARCPSRSVPRPTTVRCARLSPPSTVACENPVPNRASRECGAPYAPRIEREEDRA